MWEIVRINKYGGEIVVETEIHTKHAAIAKLRTHQFFSQPGRYFMRRVKKTRPKIIWAL